MSIDYDIRPYRPGDEAGILEGFNEVFRKVCGEGYVDRQMPFWDWEFAQNPEGQRIMVGVTAEGEIAGHYGGVPMRVRSTLGDATFVHIVDSFVREQHRAGLKRPGLFVNIGEVWQRMCKEQGDATMYGYPVITAQRVGSRFLGYEPIHVVDYLVREVGAASSASAGLEVETVTAIPDGMDALFDAFAGEHGCLLARDARYLHWRYVQIPGGATDYVMLAVRRGAALVGFVVLRPQHELVPGVATIVDWVVPGCDGEVVDAVLAKAEALAQAAGRARLMTVLPAASREHAALSAKGFVTEPSSIYLERRLNHIVADERFSTDWLREHWWYTLGDTDLA